MNEQTRKALELAREAHGYIREQMTAWDRENLHDCIDKLAGIEIPKSAPDLNLSDTAVQKRLAAQWGYMPDPADPVEQEPVRELASALLDEIDGLIEESSGVYGLHRNGDQSPWGELAEGGRFERLTSMEALRSALAAPPAPAAPVAWLRNLTDAQPHAVRDLRYRSVSDVDDGVEYVPVYVAPVAQRVNLNDRAVQKRLAAQWGFVEPPAAPMAQPLTGDHVMSALALVPTDMSHPDKCAWLAERLNGIGQGGA